MMKGHAMATRTRSFLSFLLLLAFATLTLAHDHHEEDVGPYEDNFTNSEDMDGVLKAHIGIQMFLWGLLFPAGMVLGITRSKFHVPLQVFGCLLNWVGTSLGHHHHGRSFHEGAHSYFAGYLKWYLITQALCGVFLKLHVMEGTRVRRSVVIAHGVIGKTFPVVGWVQMIFGGIAALGFCFGEHFGQCLAHFIMGSAFIGYGILLLLMMRLGAPFLERRGWSQEALDSWVIMVWGIVNTFTEHDFLQKSNHWSHKDMQHVSLGLLWWCGGALGIFQSRGGKRSVVPAIIISMTGFAMSAHAQSLEFSTTLHKLFGFCLMAAGAARIIEISFILRDQPAPQPTRSVSPSSFQHVTPFLLVLSGLTFLSVTEEQMQWIAGSGMDSTTYANGLFSVAFIIYLAGAAMIELYERSVRKPSESGEIDVERAENTGRRWHGILIPSSPFDFSKGFPTSFPGLGRTLGFSSSSSRERAEASVEDAERYEAVPLTTSDPENSFEGGRTNTRRQNGGVIMGNGNGTVFDLGEDTEAEMEADTGGDDYWDEKETNRRL